MSLDHHYVQTCPLDPGLETSQTATTWGPHLVMASIPYILHPGCVLLGGTIRAESSAWVMNVLLALKSEKVDLGKNFPASSKTLL